jgi:very-short-patch-repair endonuclease
MSVSKEEIRKNEDKLSKRTYKNDKAKERASRRSRTALFQNNLKENPTEAETIVLCWLTINNVYFKFQKAFVTPYCRIVDFYLPRPKKIILEIDGGYHKETVEKDFYKDLVWGKKGFKTIRITNEEVFNDSFKDKLKFLIP